MGHTTTGSGEGYICAASPTLRDVRTELKVARESIREMNVKRLGMACSPAHKQPTSPWDSEHGRGYVWRSDWYFSSQYLSQKNNILNCNKCKVFERKNPKPPLCNITASEPMDLVHINLLGLETTMNTKVCPTVVKILVIMDHFSCHMQAYKVNDRRAVTITKCLYDNYFRHYGFPR